ncbi:prion-inhibition and propagation-domain-containing protein [Xylariaceae sp. FL1651]|nr:prion-inhibition and propagation-domain-containing protein [Xylariaceae sp. FL1651]
MAGLEIPAFIIGVAGLFSSCVDAFSYFKLAQHANKEVEVVLLKLDIEKARLLIWGDNVGIYSAGHQHPRLRDEARVELIQRILSQIESLLTDSEKLRASFGVRTLDNPFGRAVDYVSSKSLAVFGTSASRFWSRNASRLAAETHGTRLARTKWAIYEREKFQSLVNELSHFVDRLFELCAVALEVQDRIIIEDIESILDISCLEIIEEATEDSYRIYSQAAASARASTEAGTIDRRTVEEKLREIEEAVALDPSQRAQKSLTADLGGLWSEVEYTRVSVALTSQCRKLQTQDPCDVQLLGSQIADPSIMGTLHWDVSSRNTSGGRTLWQLIHRLIDTQTTFKFDLPQLGDILRQQDELSEEREAFIRCKLPLMKLFIYCAPCVALIHTALSICERISSPFVKVYLRPDDRLTSACCTNVDRTLGLRSTLEWVREREATADEYLDQPLASFLDSLWLDSRLECLDYEQPYNYVETNINHRVLIIGEADYLSPFVLTAPGRIPRAMDIWRLYMETDHLKRTFFGRFIESRFVSNQAAPQARMPPVPPQTHSDMSKVRMPSSPISAQSKRRKHEDGSTARNRCEESEDEDMQSQNHSSEYSD